MVVNISYDVVFTNDENPHLIDTEISLFHVEHHVEGIVTELVLC